MTTTSNTETSKRGCDGIFWEAEADIIRQDLLINEHFSAMRPKEASERDVRRLRTN